MAVYEATIMILNLIPYRASYHILKLVYPAVAKAPYYRDLDKALKHRAQGCRYSIKNRLSYNNCTASIVKKSK
ncbi:hypothetical protein U9M48_017973 [Paspalum notatum var. saurae]|uniref:Uncharacterized protein n=1 Tax=Paspalum notatum var. saurae TaxID=547442 RepID=A0AAQ3TCH5_PASNO